MKTTKEQALELKGTLVTDIIAEVTGKIVGYELSWLILCIDLRRLHNENGWSPHYLTKDDKLIVPLSKLKNRRLFYVMYSNLREYKS